METAVAPAAIPAVPITIDEEPRPSTMGARLAQLPLKHKLGLGVGIALIIGLLVAMLTLSNKTEYRVLYSNLSDKDGGAIVGALAQMQVPYKYTEGGGAILVPSDKVHDIRLRLASQGLPKGSVQGLELMENARFGITQFQERVNFQRGLEGELTRSIQSLDAVQSARIHLALPNQNGFFREQQKPSASVLLTLHPGRLLERNQIAGIVHLVSSSVPDLAPAAVSVLDQNGALLSAQLESGQGNLDAQQLAYVQRLEATYTKRILDLLEPVIGKENIRAQVTADVDFSLTEATAEEFRPNQGASAPATVRSAQLSETGPGGAASVPTGVPGAQSNQPPASASAPINGSAQILQGANGAPLGAGAKRDQVTNYEVDRTVRVTRGSPGQIRRLSAAVVVNSKTVTDAKGKTSVQALSEEELTKLSNLARDAIGFRNDRGDSVSVINAPFHPEKPSTDETPWYKQPESREWLRSLSLPLLLSLVALVIAFGVVRPAVKALNPPPPEDKAEDGKDEKGNALNAVVDGEEVLPGLDGPVDANGEPLILAGPVPPSAQLDAARRLAKESPITVANVVRGWINKEESA
ncbi:MAG: flagellar basal body M-ring protein FliF [Burkholderiaceae bacterium]|nr:MAG: flagellar basal body M-ring protein FliF [Burkholderiaceae bacterium]